MKHKTVMAVLSVCSVVFCNSTWAVNVEQRMIRHFEPFLEQQMKAHDVPGFTIGIVKGGTVVYARAFGHKDLDSQEGLTTRSLFHQASLTKPLVATCIMQLVEQGKVKLDDPIIKYVPHFKLDDERYTAITIRHMVTHTSGMPDVQDYEWDNPVYDDDALERYVRRLSSEQLIAAPGEKYQYSNMAYEVLGDLIAQVSGMSFEAYVDNNILAPLKMQHSTLLKQEADSRLMSTPHVKEGDSVVVSSVYPYNRMHAPSSTLISNTVDMSRWAMANLNRGELDGRRILKESTYDVMWKPGTDMDNGIGMSWKLGRRGRLQIVFHGGRDTGYRSFILLVPEASLGIVVATNYDRTPIEPIMDAALTVSLGEAFAPHGERQAISVDPVVLKDYVGTYRIAPQILLNVTLEDDRLLTQAGGQPKTEIFPLSNTSFFLKVADVRMIFEKNVRGEVFQMLIRQGIHDMVAKRVK
jgi:CubicO group peptidase (beta-lactamase class C family)